MVGFLFNFGWITAYQILAMKLTFNLNFSVTKPTFHLAEHTKIQLTQPFNGNLMMRLTVRYFSWRQASLFFCCRPWPKVTMTVALYVSVSKVFVFPLIAWFFFETITELSWVVWLWWKGWFHFNKRENYMLVRN